MTIRTTILTVALLVLAATVMPAVVGAQTAPAATPAKGLPAYTPLEPISDSLSKLESGSITDFPRLIAALFPIMLALGALFAVVTFVWGGVVYMFSAVTDRIDWARGKMRSSIYGFLLLMLAWVILNTINPQLLNLSQLFAGNFQNGGLQQPAPTNAAPANTTSTPNGCATSSGYNLIANATCDQYGASCKACNSVSGGICCLPNTPGGI